MKIEYYRGKHPNFGDELNNWMWPRLAPGFFNEDAAHLFLGIGSIIGDHYDPQAKKIVFGAGFVPEYMSRPTISEREWDVFFVRGPRTAERLNIPKALAIGDSAILIRALMDAKNKPEAAYVSFMPHWESMERGNWGEASRLAGIQLIDPRWPVEKVIEGLTRSRLVIAEAMHGAVIADALRIPWVPVMPIHSMHRAKWLDWAEALNIRFTPQRMWPSTTTEADHALTHRPFLSAVKRGVVSVPLLCKSTDKIITYLAAQRLRQLAKVTPSLSPDQEIDRALDMMLNKLQALTRQYGRR